MSAGHRSKSSLLALPITDTGLITAASQTLPKWLTRNEDGPYKYRTYINQGPMTGQKGLPNENTAKASSEIRLCAI